MTMYASNLGGQVLLACDFIYKSSIKAEDSKCMLFPIERNLPKFNENLSKELRDNLINTYISPNIENMNNIINPAIYPILFEEIFTLNQKVDLESRKYLNDMNNYVNIFV